ncbi:hypothetical protein GCM10009760_49800 [Kitasatospora kazusensis]|uniref:DUF3618 domain-containing protein n=1 Tax=Kitasatospora kazusensis TaxID=407974 RepID=A0ABN3A2N4_9ACTN
MNSAHPPQETAAEAARAAERTERRALHRLAPKAVKVADGLEAAADHVVSRVRPTYRQLAVRTRPATARRAAGLASAGVLGLTGALVLHWCRSPGAVRGSGSRASST